MVKCRNINELMRHWLLVMYCSSNVSSEPYVAFLQQCCLKWLKRCRPTHVLIIMFAWLSTWWVKCESLALIRILVFKTYTIFSTSSVSLITLTFFLHKIHFMRFYINILYIYNKGIKIVTYSEHIIPKYFLNMIWAF